MKSSINKIKEGQIENFISALTQEALDRKFDSPTGTTEQVVLGDGTLGNFPSPITIDTNPTQNSTNAVSSGGVFNQLLLKAPINSPTFTGVVTVQSNGFIISGGSANFLICGDGLARNQNTIVSNARLNNIEFNNNTIALNDMFSTVANKLQSQISSLSGGSPSTWGSITGTLSAQTDLQIALNNATTADTSTGLYQLNEGNGIGWRLKGRNAANYGNIGLNAIDFSTSSSASSSRGATNIYSFAMGLNTTASGEYSFVHGTSSMATGQLAIAMGSSCQANATAAFAVGDRSVANNTASISMGQESISEGQVSISMGRGNQAYGNYSTAMGSRNVTWIAYSTAIGTDNNAYGNYSTVFGIGNNVHAFGDTVIGTYALTLSSGTSTTAFQTGDTAFRVGIGTAANARKDALQVYKSGLVVAPNTTNDLILSGNGKSLVTREYVDSKTSGATFVSINEGNGIGYTIADRVAANYGNIGLGAFDISTSTIASTTRGATGTNSFAIGNGGTASGLNSFVGGVTSTASGANSISFGSSNQATASLSVSLGGSNNIASGANSAIIGGQLNGIATSAQRSVVLGGDQNNCAGLNSVVQGLNNNAATMNEVVIGQYASMLTGQSTNWVTGDTVFRIGIGLAAGTRADALRVYKSGVVQLTRTPNTIVPSGSTQVLTLDGSNNVVLKDDGRRGSMVFNPSINGVINIPHGLGVKPSFISVTMGDQTSPELREYTIKTDPTNITITFMNTPSETMLELWWEAKM